MFKTISRKKGEAGSDNSDSGSDHEQQDLELDAGDEFAGFGSDDEDEDLDSDGEEDDDDEDDDDDDDDEQEQCLLNNGEDAPYGEEELPENLPSLRDAITSPIFELSKDAAGRKTLICIACPDKILREGTMKDTHLKSKSHLRRMERYGAYIKQNPSTEEETQDPRAVTAFLDKQLRIKKSGGAGFTLEPSGKRRKRRRNKKPEKSAIATEPEDPNRPISKGPPAGDGVAEVGGMTAMNAKQKRKAKQMEKSESTEDANPAEKVTKSEDVKPKPQAANGAGKQKKPFAGKQKPQQQKTGGKPGGQKQNKRPKVA